MKLKEIKPGERLSMTYYLDVQSVGGDELKVKDQNGMTFTIRGKNLIENTIQSASQFDKTEKLSRTQIVEILMNARDRVLTANYIKQDGTERTIVCHLIDSENTMGRSNVHDLEVTSGHPIRQIDHRTINWLIINNTKYQVK